MSGEAEHCENHVPDLELGESDLDCGGTECDGCRPGQHCNDSSDCAEGECILDICQEPGCENKALDGNETGVDCGGSCAPCRDGQPCDDAADCRSKVCGPEALCASPTCKDKVRNGDELDIDCGGSFCDGCGIGSPCMEAADCQSSLCDPTTHTCALNCARGTDECDGDRSDACETNLLTSVDHCGACFAACELLHATAACSGGTCRIDECAAPWLHCNTDDTDGCETNGSTDPENCGGCGIVCTGLHGEPSCMNSECAIACDTGFGDCDDDPQTGCEASVADVDNCGQCRRRCPDAEGEPYCVDGACGATDCEPGFGDCDGNDDCTHTLNDDPYNCGRCGHVCSAAHGTTECVNGVCVITECDDGWQNCDSSEEDGGLSTGCETNLDGDPKNCGACGMRCDVVEHGTGTCQDGACALDCDNGFEDCDERVDTGCETDTTSDTGHCGACENACSIPNTVAACVDSSCEIGGCVANYEDCTDAAGCETDTSSSIQHCGSCARSCSNAGATAVSCSNGSCDAPTCDEDHGNCDDNADNGCETDLTTPAQCGSCGNVCTPALPNCVKTGATYRCQAPITVANAIPYPVQQTTSTTLSFSSLPRAGTNRLVLLAIASESPNNGLAGARPDAVRYGNTNMLAGPSQPGVTDWWSPDLFVYYLALGDSAADQATVTVTVDGATAPQINGMFVQLLQLHGVRQDAPISASMGAFVGAPDPDDPPESAITLGVATNGSVIYSFGSVMWTDADECPAGAASANCPAWSIDPSTSLTVTETMSTPIMNIGGTPTRAFAMLVNAASPSLPAAGDYTARWGLPHAGRFTHLALAVAPAQSP